METTELLIKVNGIQIVSSLMVDGTIKQKAVHSKMECEALIAWLEEQTTDRVHARLRVSDASEMRLALELAAMLARAGHTISVGEACQFRPVKPASHITSSGG